MRFRDVLAAELERRRQRDRRYSLRRFARHLGVHHSTLSRMLRGTGPISARTVRALAARLGISPTQIAKLATQEDTAAVLGAIARPTFRPSARWLASVAGISIDRVNIVLQTLLRVGALRMRSASRWELLRGDIE